MTVYICLMAIFYLLSVAKIEKKETVFWLMMCSLMLISGLRYEVGWDYDNFRVVLEKYSQGISTYTEAGYNAYMWIIKEFFGSSIVVLYVGEAIFTISAFAYFIKRNVEKKYWLYVGSLFVTTTIFFQSMNVSRQYVAIGFLLIAFEQMKKKKYVSCLIFCLLACSFHSSAFIVLIFYLFLSWYKKAESKQMQIIKIFHVLVIVSIVFSVFDLRSLFVQFSGIMHKIPPLKRFAWYFGTSYFWERNRTAFIKYIIPDLLWFYIYYFLLDKMRKKSVWADCYLLMFAVYLIIGNCFYGINVLVRISWYFEVAILPLIPLVIEAHDGRQKRFITKIFFMAYYLCLAIYVVFIANSIAVVPYQTFLFK